MDDGDLIAHLERFADRCDDPTFTDSVRQIVRSAPVMRPSDERTRTSPPTWVAGALQRLEPSEGATGALLAAVTSDLDELRWFPPPATMPSALVDHLAAAELIGPDGSRPSTNARLGIFVVDADTTFPEHRHSATEYYAVIAGEAEWAIDGRHTTLAPTQVIYVPSRAWHSITTGADPMLCCYAWGGDVTFDDYQFRR